MRPLVDVVRLAVAPVLEELGRGARVIDLVEVHLVRLGEAERAQAERGQRAGPRGSRRRAGRIGPPPSPYERAGCGRLARGGPQAGAEPGRPGPSRRRSGRSLQVGQGAATARRRARRCGRPERPCSTAATAGQRDAAGPAGAVGRAGPRAGEPPRRPVGDRPSARRAAPPPARPASRSRACARTWSERPDERRGMQRPRRSSRRAATRRGGPIPSQSRTGFEAGSSAGRTWSGRRTCSRTWRWTGRRRRPASGARREQDRPEGEEREPVALVDPRRQHEEGEREDAPARRAASVDRGGAPRPTGRRDGRDEQDGADDDRGDDAEHRRRPHRTGRRTGSTGVADPQRRLLARLLPVSPGTRAQGL